jgi:myosin-5
MDTKFFFAVTFPFNPSPLGLESITLPPDWGLGFIKHL